MESGPAKDNQGMRVVALSDHAIEALKDAPQNVRRPFYKQLRFLLDNLQHPSLHAKKYDESIDLWQARVNSHWRFLFHDQEQYTRNDLIKRAIDTFLIKEGFDPHRLPKNLEVSY